MIEINLSPTSKAGDKLKVGGFDLSKLNVKMLIIALVILYIPENFINNYYDDEKSQANQIISNNNRQLKKLQSKVRQLDFIKKQVEALKTQEDKLAKKLKTVEVIINKRQNPFVVMKYIAENTPEKVWFEKLQLKDRKLEILGYAQSWKHIGDLLQGLKNSIFLSNLKYSVPESMEADFQGKKVEVFKIDATVSRFK
ncbi:MAG: PilN domain-containing protein [Bacteriovoracaceae bacterium]|jgi:Tfp pilus assembly protein PilN|nr:PilN domain-containing protein [Bacteriovoracaceae bacterium]